MQKRVFFDSDARFLLLVLLISQFFFINGIYLFIGGLCLGVIFYQLNQPFKPAVFTIIFIYHFIQIAATVWLSNFLGKDINNRSDNSGNAIIMSYLGLIVMFAPIIYFQNKIPSISLKKFKEHAAKLSINKTFTAYVIGFFSINALGAIALSISGFAQILVSLFAVKWFLYLLLGMQVFLKKMKIKEFLFFTGFEFITGFYSYFSQFKTVVFFVMFLFLVMLVKVNMKQTVVAIMGAAIVFYLMAFFQGIKGEYRQYLNNGSNTQTVTVSKDDALSKLADIASENKENSMDESIVSFLDRFQYTYHLAKAMELVPSTIPFQMGDNWGSTLRYIFTPRLLNPDKEEYEASIKTRKYTGLSYAGSKQGVSISLGYFADSYVDFGIPFMLLPIFIIGWIYGKTYYYFVRRSSNNFLFNYAVVGAMFMEFFAFEMDGTYLAGRLLAVLVTFFLLKKLVFSWLLDHLLMPVDIKDRPRAVKPAATQ
jgi:hypothetical protein